MKRVVGILAVLSVLGGSAAMADQHFDGARGRGEPSQHRDWQQGGGWNQRDDHRQAVREFHRDDRARFDRDRFEHGRDLGRYERFGYNEGRYDRPYARPFVRPYGRYDFRRGDQLPVAYYGRPYFIEDYRGCGLYAPPRGARWVRVDGNAVLAAIATGVVLDAVYHAF